MHAAYFRVKWLKVIAIDASCPNKIDRLRFIFSQRLAFESKTLMELFG